MKKYESHKHTVGRNRSVEHMAWTNMIQRCTNKNRPDYRQYGGRGITVSKEWRESFITFFMDMGVRPIGTSLDRKDNSKGYEKGNCRWATKNQQMQNTRSTRILRYKGISLGLNAWAKKIGINKESLRIRLTKMSIRDALTFPPKRDRRRKKLTLNKI